jgi:alkylhydroperoxidase family enzyme
MSARLDPPDPDELTPEAAELLAKLPRGPDGPLHLMAALIHHPELLRGWGRFTGALFRGVLPPRTRELLILRTAWNVRSEYEWGNHVAIALEAGLTEEEIERLSGSAEAGGWSATDRVMVEAADELHEAGELSEAGWSALAGAVGTQAAIEVLFVVGAYHVVRTLVASLGVLPETGRPGLGRSR